MEIWLIALLGVIAAAVLSALITYFFSRSGRSTLETGLKAAQRELRNAHERLQHLSVELKSNLEAKGRMEQEARRIPGLERQIEELRNEKLEIKGRIEQEGKLYPELERQVEELRREKAELKAELRERLEQQVPELERQINELRNEKLELKATLDQEDRLFPELERQIEELRNEKLELKERLEERLPELERQVNELKEEKVELKQQIAELKREKETHEDMGEWLRRAEERLRESFQSLAAQALENNADHFLERAHSRIDTLVEKAQGDWNLQKTEFQNLVQPLEQSLATLDGQVRELEEKRESAYQKMQKELRQLAHTHEELQLSTTNLAHALKNTGARGTWGELQLRRVVELAGMVDRVDFIGPNGKNGDRPDMIVHLPNQGLVPVDAKTSMADYLDAMDTADDQIRKTKLGAYAQAMRHRVEALAGEPYRQQFEHGVEIVVMFVPNEACLGVAFEHDPELLEDAIQQGVLLTTPVTLLGLLKAVAYGWQQHQAAENAGQIASQGKQLFRRLNTFLSHVSEVGRRLDQAVRGYNKAVMSLETRVMPVARRLRDMSGDSMGLATPPPVEHQAIAPPGPEADEEGEDNGNNLAPIGSESRPRG